MPAPVASSAALRGNPRHCPHRPPCGGCPRFGERGLAPAARERLHDLARRHGIAPPTEVAGARAGFRLRARLAIRGREGNPKLGLFRPGTHEVVHVPDCVVHHPLVNEVAAEVRRALAETRVPSYAERAHAGLARYLQVVVERASQRAQVVLIGNCPDPAPFRDALARVTERLGARLHSLWYNANLTRGNAILGPEFLHLHGPASVVEAFGGPAIHYPPGAFGQSNLEVAGRIVEHVRAAVPAGARVAEFYAGVGAIGLSLAGVAGSLVVNELAPASLAGLELGIAGLDAATRARIRVRPGPAADAADAAADAEVVIVDPPRKGLDPGLVDALALAPPPRLLYISCGLEALVDDARRLTAGGALRLAELAAFDLLPYTEHVETVARFERD